jgi:hypothetical protein
VPWRRVLKGQAMSTTSDLTRAIWLWLLQNGGRWTAAEVAEALRKESMPVFDALANMSRRRLVQDYEPVEGERRKRYGVTGTCCVPQGMCVAEVQIC